MNADAILFYSIAVIITSLFFRIVLINIKGRGYIKKYHHDFWEENIHLFCGSGKSNIFQITTKLGVDDPKIQSYKNEWEKALKQLFVVVLIIVIFVISYVALFKMKLIRV